jgi:uncharacterized membrane protein
MLTVAIGSIAVGAVLGFRFKVLILFPAMVFALFVTAAVCIAHGESLWKTALTLVLVAIGVQVGYLAGTAVHLVVTAAAAPASAWLEYQQRKVLWVE